MASVFPRNLTIRGAEFLHEHIGFQRDAEMILHVIRQQMLDFLMQFRRQRQGFDMRHVSAQQRGKRVNRLVRDFDGFFAGGGAARAEQAAGRKAEAGQLNGRARRLADRAAMQYRRVAEVRNQLDFKGRNERANALRRSQCAQCAARERIDGLMRLIMRLKRPVQAFRDVRRADQFVEIRVYRGARFKHVGLRDFQQRMLPALRIGRHHVGLLEKNHIQARKEFEIAALLCANFPRAPRNALNFPVIAGKKGHDFIRFPQIQRFNHNRFGFLERHGNAGVREATFLAETPLLQFTLFQLKAKHETGVIFAEFVASGRNRQPIRQLVFDFEHLLFFRAAHRRRVR